jgi:hypothetical protein
MGQGCRGIISFSPGDSEILCSVNSGASTHSLVLFSSAAPGTSTPFASLPSSVKAALLALSWKSTGLVALYDSSAGSNSWLRVHDSARSRSTTIDSFTFDWYGNSARSVPRGEALSPSGSKVAHFRSVCTQQGGLFSGCMRRQFSLWVHDHSTGHSRQAALTSLEPVQLFFSLDETELHYLTTGTGVLFSVDVR